MVNADDDERVVIQNIHSRTELFSVCGIGVDDLTQAGSIELWHALSFLPTPNRRSRGQADKTAGFRRRPSFGRTTAKIKKEAGQKITTAVYEYLADCSGKWGELSYNFKDGIAEILQLAEWDTIVNHRFAMRAVEYLREHSEDVLPDRIMLIFIGSKQRRNDHGNQIGTSN